MGSRRPYLEKLFKEQGTSKFNQMLYINLGSCLISSSTLIASGRIIYEIGFATLHPGIAWASMTLSAAAVGGQRFIFPHASACHYGALTWVHFLVQMSGKSFEIMPVMAGGMIVGNKHRGTTD